MQPLSLEPCIRWTKAQDLHIPRHTFSQPSYMSSNLLRGPCSFLPHSMVRTIFLWPLLDNPVGWSPARLGVEAAASRRL